MRYLLFFVLMILPACSKHVALCYAQAENAHMHNEFGYFYDSAVMDVNGETTFARIPEGMTFNPCLVPPPVVGP